MLRNLIAAAIFAVVPVAAFAEEAMLVGSADPETTAEAVASALATSQEVPAVKKYDLGKPAMVSVFNVVYGTEGQRAQRLRGLAAAGLVGHAIDTPDDCQLEEQQRDDAVALALREAVAARDVVVALAGALQVAIEEQARAQEAVALNQGKWRNTKLVLQQTTQLHTAAHEAAHVVQQRAGVQLRLTLKNPTRANVIAYSLLASDVQQKVDADHAAESALAGARTAESAAHEAYNAAVEFNLLKTENTKRVRSQSTLASVRMEELNAKSSGAINAQIVVLAEAAVIESDELAKTLGRIEAAALAAAGIGESLGGFEEEVPQALRLGNVMQAAGSLVRSASELNLLNVENARRLPPIPPLSSEEAALGLPQIALLDDLADAGEQQSIAEVMIATAMAGGLSLATMKIHEMSGMLEDICEIKCGDDVRAWLDEALELQNLALQLAMQNENRQYTTVSNVLKTKHDTVKNSINNVR